MSIIGGGGLPRSAVFVWGDGPGRGSIQFGSGSELCWPPARGSNAIEIRIRIAANGCRVRLNNEF